MQNIINKCDDFPIQVALYCDRMFKSRGSLKGLDNAQIEAKVDGIMGLFKYMYGRDIFLKEYQK